MILQIFCALYAESLENITNLEVAYRNVEIEPPPVSSSSSALTSSERPVVTRSFSDTFAAVKSYDPSLCHADAGLWLQSQRENAGVTSAQLAIKTRIPKKVIENLENRELSQISVVRLQAYLFEIARYLNIDLNELRRKFGL